MFTKFMISTAAAALLAGSAFAQAPSPSPSQSSPPTTQQSSPPAMQPSPSTSASPSSSAQASGKFVTEQKPDQVLATKFKGTDVIGTNNEKIGDVSDILFDKDGKVLAYIVGVGGFLGIGQKDVALMPTAFQVMPPTDRDNMKLQLSMTKDELKAAPDFKAYNPPRTAAGGSGSAPTTGQRDRAPATAPASPPPAQR
jgi:PRC-barrel domain protein